MPDRQAVAALGRYPMLLSFPPDTLPARLQNVQHITGLTSNQSAVMLRRSVQPLMMSSSSIQASIDVFSGPKPLFPFIYCTRLDLDDESAWSLWWFLHTTVRFSVSVVGPAAAIPSDDCIVA